LKGGPGPSFRDRTLDVYQAVEPRAPEADFCDVPIPRINRTTRIELSG
jgi:hypothetical protein